MKIHSSARDVPEDLHVQRPDGPHRDDRQLAGRQAHRSRHQRRDEHRAHRQRGKNHGDGHLRGEVGASRRRQRALEPEKPGIALERERTADAKERRPHDRERREAGKQVVADARVLRDGRRGEKHAEEQVDRHRQQQERNRRSLETRSIRSDSYLISFAYAPISRPIGISVRPTDPTNDGIDVTVIMQPPLSAR